MQRSREATVELPHWTPNSTRLLSKRLLLNNAHFDCLCFSIHFLFICYGIDLFAIRFASALCSLLLCVYENVWGAIDKLPPTSLCCKPDQLTFVKYWFYVMVIVNFIHYRYNNCTLHHCLSIIDCCQSIASSLFTGLDLLALGWTIFHHYTQTEVSESLISSLNNQSLYLVNDFIEIFHEIFIAKDSIL